MQRKIFRGRTPYVCRTELHGAKTHVCRHNATGLLSLWLTEPPCPESTAAFSKQTPWRSFPLVLYIVRRLCLGQQHFFCWNICFQFSKVPTAVEKKKEKEKNAPGEIWSSGLLNMKLAFYLLAMSTDGAFGQHTACELCHQYIQLSAPCFCCIWEAPAVIPPVTGTPILQTGPILLLIQVM